MSQEGSGVLEWQYISFRFSGVGVDGQVSSNVSLAVFPQPPYTSTTREIQSQPLSRQPRALLSCFSGSPNAAEASEV